MKLKNQMETHWVLQQFIITGSTINWLSLSYLVLTMYNGNITNEELVTTEMIRHVHLKINTPLLGESSDSCCSVSKLSMLKKLIH